MWSLSAWRRRRILARHPIADELWQRVRQHLIFLDGISAVMIGHTHRTLYGYPYETKSGEAIQVYNTGGLITGANFMPMEIDMGENGKVVRHDDGRLKIQPIRGQLHILDTPSR